MIRKSACVWAAVLFIVMACGGVARAAQKTGGAGSKKPPAAQPAKAKPAPAATHTVVVYYLYTEPRCISCTNIEKFTKEAIEKEFAKELKSGRLVWMPVDVKKDGNWHYVEDFQLRSKTVVVADYKDSREDKNKIIAWKSLEEVWPLLKDKKKFMEYIQTEARIFLDQKYEKPKSDEKKDAGKAGGEKK